MVILGENVRVTVAKGLPLNPENASVLTEAEKEEVRDNEGEWIITEIGVGVVDPYLSQLSKNPHTQNGCDHIVLIGGIPGMRQPAALSFRDGKAEGWLTLGYQYPILEELPKTRSLSYTLYDYETVMDASQKYVYLDDNTAGGGGVYLEKEVPISIYIVAVPVAIIAIVVGFIVIWDKKKYREKIGQS